MAYGINYSAEFDNVAGNRYRMEILRKDYVSSVLPLVFSGTPVKHAWQTDEPKAAIKGSSLTLTLFNTGSLPITTFYSTNDDEFKGKFYKDNDLLFEGFLVQDDCVEPMADYTHEIILSFNDNLGLLKDVALDVALDRVTLLSIIAVCLGNTGLELDTYVYASIFETTHSTDDSFLAQTFIDTRTFLNGAVFDNCYNVLTSILERFNLSLFQANGAWQIVRWDEVRYQSSPDGFQYDSDFNLIDTDDLIRTVTTGFQQAVYPEVGLQRSIFRPFKYDKETFNYKQPEFLILNSNLIQLGAFDSTNTIGDLRYDVYEFPTSSGWDHWYSDTSKIVVVTNTVLDKEVERYVLQPKSGLTGSGYTDFTNVEFNDIQVSAGDIFDFELKIKSDSSTGGDAVGYRFGFFLMIDENNYYALVNGSGVFAWNFFNLNPIQGIGFSRTVLAADAEEYFDFKCSDEGTQLRVPKFPVDGVLRIRIYGTNDSNVSQPNVGAIWKDIKLTLIQYINDSTKIIGHTHTSEQSPAIKNNEDIEIFVDDSPRSTIAGTLYIAALTGLAAIRTEDWFRASNPSELLRIGQITTFEQLFWRRNPRTKLEGTFYGVNDLDTGNISMLRVLKNVAFNELNFLFGSLEIDYKNNSFNCTMWEQYEDGEVDGDLTSDYTFNYIYATN